MQLSLFIEQNREKKAKGTGRNKNKNLCRAHSTRRHVAQREKQENCFGKWSKFAFQAEKFSQQAKGINATTAATATIARRPSKSVESKKKFFFEKK